MEFIEVIYLVKKMWQKRKKKFAKSLLVASKYLLNDSFVAIILVLLLLFFPYLSTIIEELLRVDTHLIKIATFFLALSILTSQRMFLFMEEPDQYFLLPKENEVVKQLKIAAKQSFFLAIITHAASYFLIFFLLSLTNKQPLFTMLTLFIVINLLIVCKIFITFLHFYDKKEQFLSVIQVFFSSTSLLFTICEKYFIVNISLITYLLFLYKIASTAKDSLLNWNAALTYEYQSLSKLNLLLSNFLSVKKLHTNLSSPAYLNQLFRLIPKNNDFLLVYLYFRKVFRNRENRVELFLIPLVISFVSVSLDTSVLSTLIPAVIFVTTTITLSEKASLSTYSTFTITKKQLNLFIFCILLVEICLFTPIFVYLIATKGAYIYIIGSIAVTTLFLKYNLKKRNQLSF